MVKLWALTLSAALGVALNAAAQEPANRYDALKHALGLSDTQLSQLQQKPPPANARPAPTGGAVAIYSAGGFGRMPKQPAANEESLRILDDSQRTKLAAIQKVWDRWDAMAFTIEFGLIDEKLWPGGSATLCYSPIRAYAYVAELGLSEFQILQLEQLKEAARATHSRPPHDLALAALDGSQRANLTAFETALQVANEAMELRLIPTPLHGEPLCH
jgi:hypothetical protein